MNLVKISQPQEQPDHSKPSIMCGIREPNTLSNISQVKTTHLHLDWTISFEKNILSGHVVLDLITLVDNVDKVILDSSFLDVTNASYEGKDVKVSAKEIFFVFLIVIIISTFIHRSSCMFPSVIVHAW
jgi:hypothetical protein